MAYEADDVIVARKARMDRGASLGKIFVLVVAFIGVLGAVLFAAIKTSYAPIVAEPKYSSAKGP